MNESQIKEFGSKFDLHPSPPEETVHTFKMNDLTDEEGMRAFIASYRPMMKALDDKAVAAYFGGWFSSVAMALQYSVSLYSAVPEISLSNLSVHLIPSGQYCRVAFSLESWDMNEAPADPQGRMSWRNEVINRFYAETAGPLFRMMSTVSGLILGEIWGQMPTKFNYFMESLAAAADHEELLATVQEDYNYLKDEMPAEVFLLPKNPFHVKLRRIESLADSDKTVLMRNRCCMYYRTEGGSYCYTCPRIKEEERATRRTEFRKQAAAAQG
ncbi:hypothetical protein C2I18_28090 [Paenibacillus sp. PK3_47]|uniref:(2Fe-2S)-binding protein n=1 Tax=Paenibacillus sp. PK3_47 TaxID=2072642 RepID=UPI00201D6EE8|nr:(2Fe-2S)-binding protein [Paenibacillus sp. PK3_47]UQZ37059.1 hypothetical protein C2I18_28090 [Paenibacillus sp. PK3_47]